MTLIEQYQVVLIFLLVGVAMVVAPMVMLSLLRPRKPQLEKSIPYECGKDPIGDAQVCFDLRFYTDALIFVIFDVEAAFLFPWARVFKDARVHDVALVEGLIFVAILFLGLVYVWVKGDIDWIKSLGAQPGVVRLEGVVPTMPAAPAVSGGMAGTGGIGSVPPAGGFEPVQTSASASPAASHGH